MVKRQTYSKEGKNRRSGGKIYFVECCMWTDIQARVSLSHSQVTV